jgi:ubiquinone/menaquinone biosynthesis C-methylase UbiE
MHLIFQESSFDVITNVVSVDYLARPIQIFEEMMRVTRPGGRAIMSFSNRMFWSKAIKIWTAANEWQRVLICASYFQATGWEDIQAQEVTLSDGHDPVFVVTAVRPADVGASAGTGSPKSEL